MRSSDSFARSSTSCVAFAAACMEAREAARARASTLAAAACAYLASAAALALARYVKSAIIATAALESDAALASARSAFSCSSVSLLSCFVVVWSFVTDVASRRHPSPIVFYRTLTNLVSAACMIYANARSLYYTESHISCHADLGRAMASVFELTAITSEGWFVVLIIDLLTSLTNPFADYRANMRRYHGSVWTLGLIAVTGINSCPSCQGELTPGVCWFNMADEWEGTCLWWLYLAWICVFYGFGAYQVGGRSVCTTTPLPLSTPCTHTHPPTTITTNTRQDRHAHLTLTHVLSQIIYAKCYLIGSHHLSKGIEETQVSGPGGAVWDVPLLTRHLDSLGDAPPCGVVYVALDLHLYCVSGRGGRRRGGGNNNSTDLAVTD